MPAKGKHRRPKSQRFTRSVAVAVAGTGGAALALPLMGAAGAHAATADTAAQKTVAADSATQKATAGSYTVKSGDCLSKIADTKHVSGGWKQLYQDNREAVGSDPSLIRPGLKLTLAAAGSGSAPGASGTPAEAGGTEPAAQAVTSAGGYTLPVEGAAVGTPYHQAGGMWSSGYHTGTDFVVPTGTTVKAVAAGTVVTAGWGGAYGNQVVIQHSDGRYSQYAHMSSLAVSTGQAVTEGQQIGLSGATGNVTGPHVHFEIRTAPDYGSDIDPLAYLRAHGVSV